MICRDNLRVIPALKNMIILAIDTSCDETSVAVTCGRKILANKIYSQVLIHKKWGGVVPSLAKRAHEEKIDLVIDEALKTVFKTVGDGRDRSPQDIDYIAVTYGPGLAVALEVGIKKAKELALKYHKKIIPVNHMEGHIYSCFAQNQKGNPKIDFHFPYLAFLISGGHTELVLFKNHLNYEVIGETIDDSAGEALDKAAKILGFEYPGGPVIERLAMSGNSSYYNFPRPLTRSNNLNFSFSGLKTSFYYFLKNMNKNEQLNNLNNLAAAFQEAVFDTLLIKLEQAIKKTVVNKVLIAGGVSANLYLRKKIRQLIKTVNGSVLFPAFKSLYTDNAAMIGIAGYYKAQKGIFVQNLDNLDRQPRAKLS